MARLVQSQQALLQGIDAERDHLEQQRTVLEGKRRVIVAECVREPIITNAPIGAVILAAGALPLADGHRGDGRRRFVIGWWRPAPATDF